MILTLHNNDKLSEYQIRQTITKMISRKGYTVLNDNGTYSIKNLETIEQQEFIRNLVMSWCDKNDIKCSIQ